MEADPTLNESEALDFENEDQIEVRFTTKLTDPALQVEDTPFFVPLRLARHGLSEIINSLLDLDPPRLFDFLINNQFLRTSLLTYVQQRNVNREETLAIEYTEVMPEPEHKQDLPHDDWVACVAAGGNPYIVSGSFDQQARLWNAEGECVAVLSGHTGPVKGVAWMSKPTAESASFVTASQDFSLFHWKVDTTNKTNEAINKYVGHTGSVECVAVEPTFERFCSGSWDHSIKLWYPNSTPAEEEKSEVKDIEIKKSAKKKAKVTAEVAKKGSIRTLLGHTLCVSSVAWPTPYNIYSGSWDHSLRQWDVETGIATRVMAGDKVVSSISYSTSVGLLASGHNDKVVRIWDPRSSDAVVKDRLISHKLWVSSVAWHPTSSLLLTGSHDGTIKVWDARSRIPLHTLPGQHKGKVLCVAWDGDRIVSGGADNVINIHKALGSA